MATITATVDTVPWPYRVAVAVTGLSVGEIVQVYRQIGSARTIIRGGEFTADASSAALVDAEQPFGVAITYGLTIDGDDDDTDGPVTVTLSGDATVVLTDAITGMAAKVNLVELVPRYDSQSTVFRVGGRNVIVSNDMGQWTDEGVWVETDTQADSDALQTLLRNATKRIVQIRQDGTASDIDDYMAVTGFVRRRLISPSSHVLTIWTLEAAQSDPWPAAYPTSS